MSQPCPVCDAIKTGPFTPCPACGTQPFSPFDDPPEPMDRGPGKEGLSLRLIVALAALGLVATPLPALSLAWGWWTASPRAARQALGVALMTGALDLVAWIALAVFLG